MPIRIVCIEDENEITELLSVVLDSPDLEVISAHTAYEGLELVRELHPNMVIMDIVLPDMDGWIVYDEIRNNPELAEMPIVVLTALRREFQPRRMFRNGPRDLYLTKPFDMLELRNHIESMLGQQIW
jgi:two-component system, OmpR family, response regulator VicR